MEDVTIAVALPSGASLLVAARPTAAASEADRERQVRGGDDARFDDREQDVGAWSNSLQPVLKTIEELAHELYGVFDRARPAKASVEFGIELAVSPGKILSAMLINGSSKAALKVTLEWTRTPETKPPA